MRRSDASGFSQGWFPPDLRQPRGRVFEGRLSATPGTDVTTADVTAGTTLSYTESRGNLISLPWKPGKWEAFELPRTPAGVYEVTKTFLASSPWAIASGSNYDVFGFLGPNGPDMELGPAWASDSARAATGALARRNGVRVLARDQSRVYLGTIRASGTNVTEDSASKRFCWNMYNRRLRHLFRTDSTTSWTQGSTNVWRQANANAANEVYYVAGLEETPTKARSILTVLSSANSLLEAATGVGVDSTTVNSAQQGANGASGISSGGQLYLPCMAFYTGIPGIGYHRLVWIERGNAAAQHTYADGNLTGNPGGIAAEVMA